MRSKKKVSLFEQMVKLHKDKRGMTLVEVIIAITILTIVAVSVLHSLTTAMIYNKKARNRQEMTLTAESIMETFKGYDLDSLKDRFSGGSIGGVIGIEGVAYESVDGDSGYRYTATPIPFGTETADEYQFCIEDMKADDGQLYDVKITATPNSIEQIMVPDNMETTRDAIYKANWSIDTSALQKAKEDFRNYQSDLATDFAARHSDAVFKSGGNIIPIADGHVDNTDKIFQSAAGYFFAENYVKLHEKKLTIEIVNNAGEYEVRPKISYSYYMEGYPYYVRAEDASMPADEYDPSTPGTPGPNAIIEHEPDTTIRYPESGVLWFDVPLSSLYPDGHFYKNPTAAGLDRLFVYYYPQYNLDPGCDTIEINNQAGIPNFQCYLLKQRAADISEITMETKENGYQANVNIINSASGFKVFHNFDDNISEIAGGTTAAPSITGTYEKAVSYTKAGSDPDMTELMENFSEAEVLSYRLTLEVTQNGRTVTTLESSMNERINE